MNTEEKISQELTNKFSFLADHITIARARRIFVNVDYSNFMDVFMFCVNKLNFPILCTITGLDENNRITVI